MTLIFPATFRLLLLLPLLCASFRFVSPAAIAAATVTQKKEEKKEEKSKKDKKGKSKVPANAPAEAGTPVLWADRGDIAKLELYYGIGSPEEMPKSPFQFDKEDVSGTNPKIKVIDANGVKWNIKFDEEVHGEVAASRIVWACGFMVEESYFVPAGKVNGVTGLERARKFVGADGSFTDGMFEKRPDNIARRRNNWTWDSNPFVGTKELSGLMILLTMLNNWDAKPTNNNVLGMYDDAGKIWDWYLVADWGGSFGKMSGFVTYSKWNLEDYNRQAFLEGVSGGKLKLHYRGRSAGSIRAVPVEHAKWFAGIVGQLTDAQLRDAFKAGAGTSSEIEGFTRRVRAKINELKAAVGN